MIGMACSVARDSDADAAVGEVMRSGLRRSSRSDRMLDAAVFVGLEDLGGEDFGNRGIFDFWFLITDLERCAGNGGGEVDTVDAWAELLLGVFVEPRPRPVISIWAARN
jgi:hypothetical protein